MKILILGGTIFLGKHIVNSALSRGHEVTLFNRGKHNPELYPELEKLTGDRSGDFESLKGKTFDAVIDTSGYFPRIVKMSGEFLKDKTSHYTFISSISVYKDFSDMSLNENSETGTIEDESIEEITGGSYGPLKVLCENAIEEIYKASALNIRPGLIVGEDDPTDRFAYWIYRINKGGKILAPGEKKKKVQFIDVKDLSDWTIKMIEKKKNGVYNATGPDYNLTFEKLLEVCKKVSGTNPEIEWVDEKFLTDEKIAPYTELPLWLPEDSEGGNNVNISKAIKDGLTFRSLEETLRDSLEYVTRSRGGKLKFGLDENKEIELLKKWEERKNHNKEI